jgi:hypothetical protein
VVNFNRIHVTEDCARIFHNSVQGISDIIREGRQRSGDYVRGIVKTFDAERGIGIILDEMGRKYPLTLADVITTQPLATSQLVHFSVRFVNNHAFATSVGRRDADRKRIT